MYMKKKKAEKKWVQKKKARSTKKPPTRSTAQTQAESKKEKPQAFPYRPDGIQRQHPGFHISSAQETRFKKNHSIWAS